jgi:hypothetical protein
VALKRQEQYARDITQSELDLQYILNVIVKDK